MAEGGEDLALLKPFEAELELEPPASIVGSPIGSLREIFMDQEHRMNFRPSRRVLGRIRRKIFKTPKPLLALHKMIKRLVKLPLNAAPDKKEFEMSSVKRLRDVVPILGLENIDVSTKKIKDLYAPQGSSANEKKEFFIAVADYLINLLAKGPGDGVVQKAGDDVAGGTEAVLEDDNDEEDEDFDKNDEDDEFDDEDDYEELSEEEEERVCTHGNQYDYSDEEDDANLEDSDDSGEEDVIERQVNVDDELVKTVESIIYATEVELFYSDMKKLTVAYYGKRKIPCRELHSEELKIKAGELADVIQQYTEPLIEKYSIQVLSLALKSDKLEKVRSKFPVALYNQLKDRINRRPLKKQMAGENWQLCVVWIKMWLKMRDPQSTRPLPALDEKVKCTSCLTEFLYRKMVVLDSCDHSFCQRCTRKLITAENDLLNKIYVARCPLCKGYFRSWTTRTDYIKIRNRLKNLDAFSAEIPPHLIPEKDSNKL